MFLLLGNHFISFFYVQHEVASSFAHYKLSNIHLNILETAREFSKINAILEATLLDNVFFWIILVCLFVIQSLIYFNKPSWFRELPASIDNKTLTDICNTASIGYLFFQSFGRYHSPLHSLTKNLSRFSLRSLFMWATLITLTSELSNTYYLHFIRMLNKSMPTCFLPLITPAISFIDNSLYGIINRGFLLSSIACRFQTWILLSSPHWASILSKNSPFLIKFQRIK